MIRSMSAPPPTVSPPHHDATAEALRERRLFFRLNDPADPLSTDAVIERYLPLARRLALHYRGSGEPLDDLIQVACLGLVKAVRRFEPIRGNRFGSFAIPVIRGELLRYLRDTTWLLRMGREQQGLALLVERTAWELMAALGRSPTAAELATALDCLIEDVVDARLALLCGHRSVSLDAPLGGPAESDATMVDLVGGEDRELDAVLDRGQADAFLRTLPREHREIVRLRYQHDLTQGEISRRVGVSQMRVSRVLQQTRRRIEGSVEAPEQFVHALAASR
jgi:RNA polymerase sigma-B factor